MSESWQRFDLQSEGLQAVNLKLVRRLRRRSRAYALWSCFPLGLHRDYLAAHPSAWGWRLASFVLAAAIWAGPSWWMAPAVGVAMLAFAVYDLYWIDQRVTALNKALRKDAFLSKTTPGAPAGFRGRLADDTAATTESAGSFGPSHRVLSFAEQERRLRESAARRRRESSPRD